MTTNSGRQQISAFACRDARVGITRADGRVGHGHVVADGLYSSLRTLHRERGGPGRRMTLPQE